MSYTIVGMSEVYTYRLTDTAGTFQVLVCEKCGMPVARSHTDQHDSWHEKLDEDHDKIWRAGLE